MGVHPENKAVMLCGMHRSSAIYQGFVVLRAMMVGERASKGKASFMHHHIELAKIKCFLVVSD